MSWVCGFLAATLAPGILHLLHTAIGASSKSFSSQLDINDNKLLQLGSCDSVSLSSHMYYTMY